MRLLSVDNFNQGKNSEWGSIIPFVKPGTLEINGDMDELFES